MFVGRAELGTSGTLLGDWTSADPEGKQGIGDSLTQLAMLVGGEEYLQ